VSVSTKPRNVLERAHAEGFCCLQIFASSPSSWHVPSKDSDAFAAFHTLWKEIGIEQLYLHAIY
jgi:endonuclease IV